MEPAHYGRQSPTYPHRVARDSYGVEGNHVTARRWFAAAVVAAIAVTACAGSDDDSGSDPDDLSDADPGDCITVDMAVSSEKIALLTELAEEFNSSDDAEIEEGCV